jgi:tRNA uridine 5-carbamoylmethylation protein Kti12
MIAAGVRFTSAANELSKRLPFQYRDNPRSVATLYIWDPSMPIAARRDYIASAACGSVAFVLAAAAFMQVHRQIPAGLFALIALATAGDVIYRWNKFRNEAANTRPKN